MPAPSRPKRSRTTYGYTTWFTPGFINTTQRYRPTEHTIDNLSSQLRMHLSAAKILVQRDGITYWCPNQGEEVALDSDFATELQAKIVSRWGRAGVKDMEELHRKEVLGLRKTVDVAVNAKMEAEAWSMGVYTGGGGERVDQGKSRRGEVIVEIEDP